jgi:hypothetical protein
MTFEVLVAVKMFMLVFRVVMPHGLVHTNQHFGGTYCHHLQDITCLMFHVTKLQQLQQNIHIPETK